MSPSGSRKMFPAWSRAHTHATPQWRRPHGFRPCGQSPSEHVPTGPVPIGDRVPTVACDVDIAGHIQVSEWRAWRPDGTCMIDVPTLAEVSTQPCKRKRTLALDVACTKYMVQVTNTRSAERGRGTHIVPNPHRRAEVFGALLEIAFRAVASQRRIVLGCQA